MKKHVKIYLDYFGYGEHLSLAKYAGSGPMISIMPGASYTGSQY